MNAAKGNRPLRNLTALEKVDAIQRVRNGSSKASVARDIGVPESTLRGWCKNEDKLRCVLTNSMKTIKCENDAGMYDVLQEKRAKLDTNSPFTYDSKMNYVAMTNTNGTSLGVIDFSNSDRRIGLQNSSSNLAAICNENNIRSYGSNANSSVEAVSPSTTLSQFSGTSDIGQSPFGMSFNEIASNLILFAQLNSQSGNFGTGAGFSNSQSKGLGKVRSKQISNSFRANNVNLQHKSSTMRNIGIGVDMISKSKQQSAASFSQDRPTAGDKRHRQAFDSVLPQYSYPMQWHHAPSISTPTRGSTTLQTSASPSSGMSEDVKYSQLLWLLNSQLSGSMMTENLRNNKNSSHGTNHMGGCSPSVNNNSFNNNNQNNINDPEDLCMQRQVTSSTSSPVPEQKYRVDEPNKGQSKIDVQIETFRVENNDEDDNVEIETSYPDQSGMTEAVEHGKKFLKWLETYSDPTITAMQVKQCRSLLQWLKLVLSMQIIEFASSKILRRMSQLK